MNFPEDVKLELQNYRTLKNSVQNGFHSDLDTIYIIGSPNDTKLELIINDILTSISSCANYENTFIIKTLRKIV